MEKELKYYFMNVSSEDFDVYVNKVFGTCEFAIRNEEERKEVFKKIIESIYKKYPELK